MKTSLSAAEIKSVLSALYLAKQWELSVIDSCSVEYAKGPDAYRKPKVVAKEYKHVTRACEKNIRSFDKIRTKLLAVLKPGKK